ncbi:hypothetical protein [Streptomyces blattellae]|uniref:hypothetical protein n=1 Tax=Streptomyces blattellae TaxID=2569855 RepID=UPI0012B7719C|nr:hypothetical protein [Streptomyces blattellae]
MPLHQDRPRSAQGLGSSSGGPGLPGHRNRRGDLGRTPPASTTSSLFADYSTAEIAVLNDWFTPTTGLARTSIEELHALHDTQSP